MRINWLRIGSQLPQKKKMENGEVLTLISLTHSCKHSNGPSGSIQCKEFLEHLSNYQLLKKVPAP
jgi:hypothetical protein